MKNFGRGKTFLTLLKSQYQILGKNNTKMFLCPTIKKSMLNL
jgi:hypothetical protein